MVSLRATGMAITLLSFCLLATNTSAAYRRCCRSYMSYKSKIPFDQIQGFSVQTVKAMCPINAIIFHTKAGKACTNPALRWVMDSVNRLRVKAQKVHNNNTRALN
ncbi:C-C motif chemokine 20a.3 [Brachionichthys hirsutus]|uniref:C-C motif chemokine 20a.3 n=1 Tax=Brachionichthys hirsutus TaxID=412623 RepID=UPI0036048B6D